MQIRDVLQKPGLNEKHLYHPVLDTFMRALPYHYRKFGRKEGFVLCVNITGESGGEWHLFREKASWKAVSMTDKQPDTIVTIDSDIAWKIFTKWIDKKAIRNRIRIEGDEQAGNHLLKMPCILIS